MAYGYWKTGMASREAVFHLFFREHPFGGGYTIACGLEPALRFIESFHFDESDREYLGSLQGNDGKPLFNPAFLEDLGKLRLECDIDAIPEGTVVFPNEPLLRVRGRLLECQLLETPLLNLINFQTLIATKAARVTQAAGDDPVLEFGLRRAQGIDGGIAASRAAFVGGCAATSNLLAGKLYAIPVKGTHAHSWVMSFETEAEAFQAYAEAMPNNCVFLVDTYDTIEGVREAIRAGTVLRQAGHEMVGIRLDSGDLAQLSRDARRLLDDAGFPDAAIVASNDLDEYAIAELKGKGAAIGVWGVGTRLATAHGQSALGGVYKLSAIRDESGNWRYKIKISSEVGKSSNPGILQVRRFSDGSQFSGDVIYNEAEPPEGDWVLANMETGETTVMLPAPARGEDLLRPAVRGGTVVAECPPLPELQRRAKEQLARFPESLRQLREPRGYPVGLEQGLYRLRARMLEERG
jgi:nicotinate phosphoribosyltransferase